MVVWCRASDGHAVAVMVIRLLWFVGIKKTMVSHRRIFYYDSNWARMVKNLKLALFLRTAYQNRVSAFLRAGNFIVHLLADEIVGEKTYERR